MASQQVAAEQRWGASAEPGDGLNERVVETLAGD